MDMRNDVAFFENTDNTHCFQAVIKMILKYFWPKQEFSWQELEAITAKVDGLWTWPTACVLWLHRQGFEVKDVEPFNCLDFIERGGDYLIDVLGEEVGKAQIAHSNIAQEISLAKSMIEEGLHEDRIPVLTDIKAQLDAGYLVICNINSHTLNGRSGYAGHFVLITGYQGDSLIMHDPGLPGIANRRVSPVSFEHAWAYPDEQAKNYIAIRYKG